MEKYKVTDLFAGAGGLSYGFLQTDRFRLVAAAEINTETKKENKTMTKTMKIEGMMCGHCEAAVKKALEALDGVASAEVSHEKGTAVVTLEKDVDNAVLTKAVEDKDYKVVSVQ